MVNVCDVAHWFRDATSDRRLEALCRLLDCCMPLELQFLTTYLDELLRRNLVPNQHPDTNMPELHEITDSTCRRQLCLILTRLKSANVVAGCIYNILIQYNFSEFFSRVFVMEEELVDEILLLFTLAANHPAMNFTQRRNLHQRLRDLRETIEKSFKCYQSADVCSPHNQEYIYKPLEYSSIQEQTNSNEQQDLPESPNTELNMQHAENAEKTDVPTSKNTSGVHIKDLRVVRVQQKPFDKKYEYIFEVTWSNGKVARIHRAYGELFDFQCKLRRRYSKEISKMTEKKVIPYLPARRSIKFCKGNQTLPDITHYVREFAKLPDKLLHSESVETFFSDGTEKDLVEKQPTSKSKQPSNYERSDNVNVTCKHADVSRVDVVVKSVKGTGSIKNLSPKGKCTTSTTGKKFNNSVQTSGKLESKKRALLSPKPNVNVTSPKDGGKTKAVYHQPKAILKSPKPSTFQSSPTASNKQQTIRKENNIDSSLPSGINLSTTDNIEGSISGRTMNKNAHIKVASDDISCQDTATGDVSNEKTDSTIIQRTDSCMTNTDIDLQKISTTSAAPLVMAPPGVISPTSSAVISSTSFTQGSLMTMTSLDSIFSRLKSPITTISSSASTTSSKSPAHSIMTPLISKTTAITSSSTSLSSTTTSSSTTTVTSSRMVSSTSPCVASSTLTIASPTTNMFCSFTTPLTSPITTFSRPTTLTIKSPQVPLTVAVPLASPPCVTCSISNQPSSDGSVTSSLSKSPISSPDFPRTYETSETKFSFNRSSSNDSTVKSAKCKSPSSKLCQCEKSETLHHDSAEDEVPDFHCEDYNEKVKMTNFDEQRLKAVIHHLRTTPVSGKNGYTSSRQTLPHGLLIVHNGYNHAHRDPSSHNYECHAPEHSADVFLQDGFASPDATTKTSDKNCNYIFENGRYDGTLDFNSNKYEYKRLPYLNKKLNGFSKLYCYNCGEYGHSGNQCSGTGIDESIVS